MDYNPTVERIKSLLDQYHCDYVCFEHAEVRTSEEAAIVRPEYSISQGAKALIIRAKLKNVPKEEEKQFIQVVVPGDMKFDTKKVCGALNAKDVRFATPDEVAELTDGIVPGGIPPFGNLFGLVVVADTSLFSHEEMIFNAGDRRFSIAMKTADYRKIVNPLVVEVV